MFCGGCGDDLSEVQTIGTGATALASVNEPVGAHVQTESSAPAAIALPPIPAANMASLQQADPQGNVLYTMSWQSLDGPETRALPLTEGLEFQIHREGSSKTLPGITPLGIPSSAVSSAPIMCFVRNGKVVVKDTGSTHGFFVTRLVTAADGEVEIDPDKGEYIIAGEVISFQ